MQKVVADWRKDKRDSQGPHAVYAYQELIRNGFLQARSLRERLASIYQAHWNHQTLAKSVASELDGSGWHVQDPPSGSHWDAALYQTKHPIVQAVLYHEHRAKLAILKGAVEYALLKTHDLLPKRTRIRFLGMELIADFLPENFHSAVRHLESIEGFERIASLWQSFLWKWGGFFLTDKEDEEIAVLADEVGMTTSAASSAMKLYDILFPIATGWFQDIQGTKILKLFPAPFRGIGVHYRLERQNTRDLQEAFGPPRYRYLMKNLSQWNNSTVDLLQYGVPGASR